MLNRVFDFIDAIDKNNNREWFAENKQFYLDAKDDFELFLDEVGKQLEFIDNNFKYTKAKDYTFRIYRDVRFSKNKAPYKNHFGAYLCNGGRKSPVAGYYLHIEPNASFIGGGIYRPNKEYLKAIRQEVYYSYKDLESIVLKPSFKKYYPEMMDDKLKIGPKDFSKDCDAINWLKYKSLAVGHGVSREEVVSENYAKEVIKGFEILKPLNDFLNNAIRENIEDIAN